MQNKNKVFACKIKKILCLMVLTIFAVTLITAPSAGATTENLNIFSKNNVTFITAKNDVASNKDNMFTASETNDGSVADINTKMYTDDELKICKSIDIKFIIDGMELNKKVIADTVGEAIKNAGIETGTNDIITPAPSMPLNPFMVIDIKKAVHVTLSVFGYEESVYTHCKTVKELLHAHAINIGEEERVDVDLNARITGNMIINVIKLGHNYIDVEEEIPFQTEVRYTSELEKGTSRTISNGSNGKQVTTYLVNYENGIEVSRSVYGKMVTVPAVNQVTEIGTATFVTTASGEKFRALKTIDVVATGYDLSYQSCGKRPGDRGYGITASGRPAQYGVIAVDRRVIPLGTRLYIEGIDGSWSYGYCVAGDTGGAIKGNRVDLFFNSRQDALNFGKKSARVYVLA